MLLLPLPPVVDGRIINSSLVLFLPSTQSRLAKKSLYANSRDSKNVSGLPWIDCRIGRATDSPTGIHDKRQSIIPLRNVSGDPKGGKNKKKQEETLPLAGGYLDLLLVIIDSVAPQSLNRHLPFHPKGILSRRRFIRPPPDVLIINLWCLVVTLSHGLPPTAE